jgi:hypothetical protein
MIPLRAITDLLGNVSRLLPKLRLPCKRSPGATGNFMDDHQRVEALLDEKRRLRQAIADLEAMRTDSPPDKAGKLSEIVDSLRIALQEDRDATGVDG